MPNKSKLEKICEFARPIETIIDINGKMTNIYFCDLEIEVFIIRS